MANFANLRCFLTSRVNQVGRIIPLPPNTIVVCVRKNLGEPIRPSLVWDGEDGYYVKAQHLRGYRLANDDEVENVYSVTHLRGYAPGFCGLRLDRETAIVCADLLAELGNAEAATLILQIAAPT